MAGLDAGFDSDEFRTAIKFAMTMGAPSEESQRMTFKWMPETSFAEADGAEEPWDWTANPVSNVTHPDVVLTNVAVEWSPVGDGSGTSMGRFDETRGLITVLDDEYEQICTADRVVFGKRTYMLQQARPIGLFDVTVWQIPIIEGDARV